MSLFPLEPMSCLYDEIELLHGILSIHAPNATNGVDITYGNGSVWGKNPPIWMVRYTGDFFELPYNNDYFDIVVFDPPHIPDTNKGDSGRITDWRSRYGLGKHYDPKDALWYRPVFPKIGSILHHGGICLLKFCDFVNSRKFHSPLLLLNDGIVGSGLHVEDIAVKARKSAGPKSPTWDNQEHLRRNHSYWIVLKRSAH